MLALCFPDGSLRELYGNDCYVIGRGQHGLHDQCVSQAQFAVSKDGDDAFILQTLGVNCALFSSCYSDCAPCRFPLSLVQLHCCPAALVVEAESPQGTWTAVDVLAAGNVCPFLYSYFLKEPEAAASIVSFTELCSLVSSVCSRC